MSCGLFGAFCTNRVCRKCRSCKACILRQRPDARDKPFDHRYAHKFPQSFTVRHLPPALDQRNISACAVNACAAAVSACMARHGFPEFRASRMFMYYNTRRHVMKLNSMNVDSGCALRDVCKALSKFGACEERLWPYSKSLLATEPPVNLYRTAHRLTRCAYFAVEQSVPSIVACLLSNGAVLMGMSVFNNMFSVRSDGVLRMPKPSDKRVGSHAVLVCGYDMQARHFLVQNCWGTDWGKGGYFQVPMDFVTNPSYCWDFWTLRLTTSMQKESPACAPSAT